jgi:hypothetical protein
MKRGRRDGEFFPMTDVLHNNILMDHDWWIERDLPVQTFVTIIAVEMHNILEKQDCIHREAIYSGLSLDKARTWSLLCLLIAGTLLQTLVRQA